MPKITKRTADAFLPEATTKTLWCGELRGFGLRVTPAGVRAFVLRYRNAASRDRTHTLGRFGVLTVDQARDEARRLLVAIAGGFDPVGERKALRESASVADLMERYLSEHVAVRNAATTKHEVERLIRKRIIPELGRFKAVDVKRSDIERLHSALRDIPRTANQVVSILSKAFNLAESWGLRPEGVNPCSKVARFTQHHRERFLSGDELARLGDALREAETTGLPWVEASKGATAKHRRKPENARSVVNGTALAVIRLLALSGARLSEARELRWEHVDAKAKTMAFPVRKGGPRRAHPVAAAALEIVAVQPRLKGCPWVFPAPTDATRAISISVVENAWQRLRTRADLEDVHLHDLRHTVGTAAGRSGANSFLIRDVLRHANVSMTAKYVNADSSPIRALSDLIGSELNAALGPRSDTVVHMKKPRVNGA